MIKNKEKHKSKNKGITLIALVITIIVLLILAGVSIAMLTGQNGILTQAQNAKNRTEEAQVNETNALTSYEQIINASTGVNLGTITGNETTNTVTHDSLGNRVVVPAGFRVVNPNDNVEDGIVIEDVSHGATAGSQFVWIPVGTGIKKKDGSTFDINLSRYTFDASSGTPTVQDSNIVSSSYCQELNIGKGNTTAKENIESETEGFRGSAIKNGGYYIGRYEARTTTQRGDKNDPLTKITVKPNDYVYNYVTQLQAAEKSQAMYTDSNFESDLMNSYAWDTAIVFLQECDDREETDIKPYSQQNSLNTGDSPAIQGTNNLDTKDIICNVYDIASNCYEWTTETSNNSGHPCVHRGGDYDYSGGCPGGRGSYDKSFSDPTNSFRPILYL